MQPSYRFFAICASTFYSLQGLLGRCRHRTMRAQFTEAGLHRGCHQERETRVTPAEQPPWYSLREAQVG